MTSLASIFLLRRRRVDRQAQFRSSERGFFADVREANTESHCLKERFTTTARVTSR